MPIRDQVLDMPHNAHLPVSGQATLRQAFAMLTSPQIDGQAWWHLIVARTNGTWATAPFEDLYRQAQTDTTKLDIPLDELDWLISARVVEQGSMGTGEAEDEARQSPGKLLVVTDGGELAGILYVGLKRGGGEVVSTSALTGLAGEPSDLTRFSDLLIKKREPKKG